MSFEVAFFLVLTGLAISLSTAARIFIEPDDIGSGLNVLLWTSGAACGAFGFEISGTFMIVPLESWVDRHLPVALYGFYDGVAMATVAAYAATYLAIAVWLLPNAIVAGLLGHLRAQS